IFISSAPTAPHWSLRYIKNMPCHYGRACFLSKLEQATFTALFYLTLQPHQYGKAAFKIVGVRVMSIYKAPPPSPGGGALFWWR
ncbi:hypothetical protein, partial [Phascolarctobacterium faecium]|uniref:hypothetical protein n=1 Tax=Phascolarctobacterium faecium TaxID=33025 RepID=UPI003AB6B007